ncbi:MAG: tRNA glutamyl-Q(34) synthetase GluQRS, partial [Desulfovibrionaceae bacterium]|nr:tRNA glutamyl-Q(34) synthetase GluQRS [Desulfovibrionaceae bacterium]
MHFGNAWSFLWAWVMVRSQGGRLILRIEDLDPIRSKPEYIEGVAEDLSWLGLDWDEGFSSSYFQSQRSSLYEEAIAKLTSLGLTYPCFCTRKELKALAQAPHLEEEVFSYPGTCRALSLEECRLKKAQGLKAALRLKCPSEISAIQFTDYFYGPQVYSPREWGGDFPLRRSDGVFSYQLACALDDALMGVTEVVRGRDLLSSTPRQLLLMQLWHYKPPIYAHIPLLLDEEGERLAKRHQSLTLRSLKAKGVLPEQIIGLLAYLAGINPSKQKLKPHDLLPLWPKVDFTRGDLRLNLSLLEDF